MTNEEKSLNLAVKYAAPKGKNRKDSVFQACKEMAAWKNDQLRKEFNVPGYCDTAESIMDFIAHDLYYKGYNKAKERYARRLREYLEKEREKAADCRDRAEFIDAVIGEFFKEEETHGGEDD